VVQEQQVLLEIQEKRVQRAQPVVLVVRLEIQVQLDLKAVQDLLEIQEKGDQLGLKAQLEMSLDTQDLKDK
jgi:hypothetical protein